MKGLVHIYTGDGKGKTTAAIGLGVRAYGRGFKVLMVQFLKGAETGEMFTVEKLGPRFTLKRGIESVKFTINMNRQELEETAREQEKLFDFTMRSAISGEWDLIILDEIMAAISADMVKIQDVADFLKNKPEQLEVVLTGRNAPAELIELADYVSDIKALKHPVNKGINARIGVEK